MRDGFWVVLRWRLYWSSVFELWRVSLIICVDLVGGKVPLQYQDIRTPMMAVETAIQTVFNSGIGLDSGDLLGVGRTAAIDGLSLLLLLRPCTSHRQEIPQPT